MGEASGAIIPNVMEEKSESLNITNNKSKGETSAYLATYNDSLEVQPINKENGVLITLAENQEAYQKGIMKITITENGETKTIRLHVDALLTVVYTTYASSINDLRKPKFRQRAYKMVGFFQKLLDRIRQ